VTKFVPLDEGVSLERGRQNRGIPIKSYFAAIGSPNVKTAADRYRLAAYQTSTRHGIFRFINIDDVKRP